MVQVTGKVTVRLNGVEYGTQPAALTVGERYSAFRFEHEPGTWGCYDEAIAFFGEGSHIAECLKPPPLTFAEVRGFLGWSPERGLAEAAHGRYLLREVLRRASKPGDV